MESKAEEDLMPGQPPVAPQPEFEPAVPAPEAEPVATAPVEPTAPMEIPAAEARAQESPKTETNTNTWPPIPEKAPASPLLRHPWFLLLVALAAAVVLDLVSYKQQPGIQWALFVVLAIGGSLLAAFIEKRSVPAGSYVLAGMLGVSGILTLFRGEGYTVMSLVLFGLVALVLLAGSFLNGQWARFRVREYVLSALDASLSALIGLPIGLTDGSKNLPTDQAADHKRGRRAAAAVIRGVLISLPLLFIFALLLGSADLVFGEQLKDLVSWLSPKNLEDVLRQLAIILVLTWALFGVLWMLITHTDKRKVPELDEPLIKPFLGLTESAIVLISLNLLFAAFLLVQFRYFFAGQANITLQGFTYAEYARRGFFELLAAAFIAWLLHYALSSLTKREKGAQRFLFSLLASLLILQVGLVLVSAFQRLSLYEQAYGFTRDRLVAHVMMVFLGLVLLSSMLLEWTHSLKRMALVLFIALFAFSLTLSALNVDALIAHRNLDRAINGEEFDPTYLVNFLNGEDAVPTLFRYYDDPTLPKDLKDTLGKVLACRQARQTEDEKASNWTGWTWPRMRANTLYADHASALASYRMTRQEDSLGFLLGDTWVSCVDPGN